jgi:hypothetical protein
MVHPSPVIKLDNALQMCFLEREFILLCITVAYQTTYKKGCHIILVTQSLSGIKKYGFHIHGAPLPSN